MEIRNALIVLTKLVKVFPSIRTHASLLEKRVLKIKEEEERDDLKVLAARWVARKRVDGVDITPCWISRRKICLQMKKSS